MDEITFDTAYDMLTEYAGVSEDTIAVVTSINGSSLDTLQDILFTVTGYRTFDQYGEEFN